MPAPRWQYPLRTGIVLAALAIAATGVGSTAAASPVGRTASGRLPVAVALVPLDDPGDGGGLAGTNDDPTDAPTTDAPTDAPTDPATPSDPDPPPTTDAPVVDSPTPPEVPTSPPPVPPVLPTDPATVVGPPAAADGPRISVQTGNATLGLGYWSGAGGTAFAITVHNTGVVPVTARISYALPAGVTDAGSTTCRAGGCVINSLAAGTSRALTVNISVGPDAWRSAPLTSKITFTASSPSGTTVSGQATWGVLFPPGPPVPGINLQVGNVRLGPATDALGSLVIRLTNTGTLPAGGVLDVVVPAGVALGRLPTDCRTEQRLNGSTLECGLGTLLPGSRHVITFQLAITAAARADAPLSGLIRVFLTPAGQKIISTQASYQITVPVDQSGVIAGGPASVRADQSPAGQTDEPQLTGFAGTMHSPGAWAVIGGAILLLLVVIVGLALHLRRSPAPATLLAVPGVLHGPGGWPRPAVPLRLRGRSGSPEADNLTEVQRRIDPADQLGLDPPADPDAHPGTGPFDPIDPSDPDNLPDPDDPLDPADPLHPDDPRHPDDPLYLDDPRHPGDPFDPDDPDDAHLPAQPSGPLEPDGPISVEWIELPQAPPPASEPVL